METEEQQVEELKKWWKENGSSIITGVILGLAVLFGVKAWFAWQERVAQQASAVYTVMMNDLEQGNAGAAGDNAGVLIADFSSTPYATLAALALARLRIEDGEPEAARTQLQWALDNGAGDTFSDLVRLRLARVLLDLQDYDGAMAQLDQAEATAGQGSLFAEVRGDIYSVQGDTEQAVAAYRSALALMTPEYPGRRLVQLKYDYVLALAPPATVTTQ